MISIIICSRKADIAQDLKDNIAATIGCEYELCVIDNSHNEYSICSAYNEGVRLTKGDILCFMHEDVLFHSDGWGNEIAMHLYAHHDVGAVGFLGGHYLPQRPCYWSEPRRESAHYIQGELVNGMYSSRKICHEQYRQKRTFVAAIDGVFMAIPRFVFEDKKVNWDADSYSGFHFYDADMCMQIHKAGMKIEVLWNVWMEHKSCGHIGRKFLSDRNIWYEKWKDSLPLICGIDMSDEDIDISRIIMDITEQSYQYLLIQNSLAYRLGKFIIRPSKDNFKKMIYSLRHDS